MASPIALTLHLFALAALPAGAARPRTPSRKSLDPSAIAVGTIGVRTDLKTIR